MNKRTKRIGFTLAAMALIGGSVYAFTRPVDVANPVPVRLEVTGPVGQRFTGTYTADGATNTVTATAPATIGVRGIDVTYEFKPEGPVPVGGEFRVELFVGDVQRLSTVADGKGVRGAYHLATTSVGSVDGPVSLSSKTESYWAGGLRTRADRAAMATTTPAPQEAK